MRSCRHPKSKRGKRDGKHASIRKHNPICRRKGKEGKGVGRKKSERGSGRSGEPEGGAEKEKEGRAARCQNRRKKGGPYRGRRVGKGEHEGWLIVYPDRRKEKDHLCFVVDGGKGRGELYLLINRPDLEGGTYLFYTQHKVVAMK